MIPKGKLIIIGGAVDTGSFTEKNYDKDVEKNLNFFERGILKRILTESSLKEKSRIEIMTTASQIPKAVGEEYIKAFSFLGAEDVGVINITEREEANDALYVDRLNRANIIMFTGGDQLRLTSLLGGTAFHTTLLKKYREEDFLIAGTSAGAAACSNTMIYQGSSSEALLKGEVKITSGLGLISEAIIDTHFVHRGRMGRLFQAVVGNPMVIGIGLGEDTGLLITQGSQMEAIGSGLVILVDGHHIKDTNITDVAIGHPVSINNLIVHVMSMYDTYDLNTHQMYIYKNHKSDNERYAKIDS